MKVDKLVANTKYVEISDNEILFSGKKAGELVEEFGSPLYLYCEDIIRANCRLLKNAVTYPDFSVNYSIKANSNISLLKIIKEEGLCVDVMSPGELYVANLAGFTGDSIFFVSNNVDKEEFLYAAEKGVRISVDSLSQLEMFGRALSGNNVAVRINPGIGDGHHRKVITGGEKTKFGVHLSQIDDIKKVAKKYGLRINGLNMHIGSNFVDYSSYIDAANVLCDIAKEFDGLDFIDIGGGLGISYTDDSIHLDVAEMGNKLDCLFNEFADTYGKKISFFMEPGRFIVAESGVLLTTVCSRKQNAGTTYIGTDCGFNILMRPMAYGAYHEIVNCSKVTGETEVVDVCGNICETGDLLAEGRQMARSEVGDTLAVLDAGAYGFSMASTYNCRVRPAEVLLDKTGEMKLIRQRETLDDVVKNQVL